MSCLLESSSVAIVDHARSLVSSGAHEEAIALLRDHLAQEPRDAAALHLLGLALLAGGEVHAAVSTLADAVDLQPENAAACLDLAKAVLSLGWVEQACVVLRQAIQVDPMSTEAFLLLASAAEAEHAYQDANVALRRAVELLQKRREESEAELDEAVPLPLPLGSERTFADFKAEGDIHSFGITGTSLDDRWIIWIPVSAGAQCSETRGEQAEEGQIQVVRLMASLPDRVAAQLELFRLETVHYHIFSAPGR